MGALEMGVYAKIFVALIVILIRVLFHVSILYRYRAHLLILVKINKFNYIFFKKCSDCNNQNNAVFKLWSVEISRG